MTTIQFLAEWALRSSILILSGAMLLRALRVKDPSIRLAAWTAMLFGSLAIPVLAGALPNVPMKMVRWTMPRVAARPAAATAMVYDAAPAPIGPVSRPDGSFAKPGARDIARFDWARTAAALYVLAALALLLRLGVGLAMCWRLLGRSRATGRAAEGIQIRESDRIAAPVTLGIARPAIVLPGDWRRWEVAKLDAVLAHERSHVRRHDPAVQLLSAIHRALLWASPLSWFLHQRIVRVAEEASDDWAVAATDRTSYAEVLLDFMRGPKKNPAWGAHWQGVPMARYGRPEKRIRRILYGTTLSRGVTRWSVAAILALGSPLAYLVAAAAPQGAPSISSPAPAAPSPQAPVPAPTEKTPSANAVPARQSGPQPVPAYLAGLGNVTAFNTVTIKPQIDGQLKSVSFKEGEMVQSGQVVATIEPGTIEPQLAQAEAQLARDQSAVDNARVDLDRYRKLVEQNAIPRPQLEAQMALVAELEASLATDKANLDRARLLSSYGQIRSPITGLAGLRLVDPGNMVHTADSTGIVIITQIQPIAVLFTIPEDELPRVRTRLKEGASLAVEAWNRANTVKIATGRLTAIDNQIDLATGTAKLKAVFDNQDDALFPNQFVNVRVLVNFR
jgi:membrane fusion protein, multidrug efflux system